MRKERREHLFELGDFLASPREFLLHGDGRRLKSVIQTRLYSSLFFRVQRVRLYDRQKPRGARGPHMFPLGPSLYLRLASHAKALGI